MNARTLARWALGLIVLNLAINLVHGWAHETKDVPIPPGFDWFVYGVILVGPILAGVLIFRRFERSGYALMALTLAASFVFGLLWHFVFDSPDHVHQVQGGVAAVVFFWSSVALAVVEVAGAALGGYGFLNALRRSPAI